VQATVVQRDQLGTIPVPKTMTKDRRDVVRNVHTVSRVGSGTGSGSGGSGSGAVTGGSRGDSIGSTIMVVSGSPIFMTHLLFGETYFIASFHTFSYRELPSAR
jgi:hypothetical protein